MIEVQDDAALLRAARQNDEDAFEGIVMMPPMLAWFQGIDTLRVALRHSWEMAPRPGVFRVQKLPMNGQLGFAFWYRHHGSGSYAALDLVVLTLDDSRQHIKEMTSFVKPELFEAVGLPRELPPQARGDGVTSQPS